MSKKTQITLEWSLKHRLTTWIKMTTKTQSQQFFKEEDATLNTNPSKTNTEPNISLHSVADMNYEMKYDL